MAVRRRKESKVVERNVQGTNLDIRLVFKHVGEGRKRKVESTTYGIFVTKNNIKDGFKTSDLAVDFLMENYHKYNRKTKKFK
jgi:hypothetical protein